MSFRKGKTGERCERVCVRCVCFEGVVSGEGCSYGVCQLVCLSLLAAKCSLLFSWNSGLLVALSTLTTFSGTIHAYYYPGCKMYTFMVLLSVNFVPQ
jgi:hypothetical protein